ncbi:uncharacterized protein ATNIH1004_000025 [Aspergillus tanneri]|uniref:Uncharacterized protein n=1 Tax=Aspergillus tanneri TaxID=1220188 RepID=A0A5M9N977_9EURO|nr:uncharacterized protein ATNIH1004_000025 [Aspergillus tanneri]KAA8651147.1 hypothetical protein ATNIH1004_000025 [Aspergillus tanneri]
MPSFLRHDYRRLERTDSDEEGIKLESHDDRKPAYSPPVPNRRAPRATTRWMVTTVILSILVLGVISLLSIKYARPRHRNASEPQSAIAPRPCGSSPSEASAAACIYDLMTHSWLPPSCFDEELTQEFRNLRQWPFYADRTGTRPLTEKELAWRTEESYTTLEYQYTHCVYRWRKQQRAVGKERDVEVHSAMQNHTISCSDLFLTTAKQLNGTNHVMVLEDKLISLVVGYPRCAHPKT